MKHIVWLVMFGVFAGIGYWVWTASRRWSERKRAAEARFASFIAQSTKPPPPKVESARAPVATRSPAPTPSPAPAPMPAAKPVAAALPAELGTQMLLFEAAAKAGEAGEPVLSIQLYTRLIARYPEGAFAAQARAALDAQKSKLTRA